MNWAALAIGVGLAAALVVIVAARRGDGSRAGHFTAAVLLLVVCLNGAAPVRGLVDPDYVGYSFGLLEAQRGLPVTLIAGTVLVASFIAAALAASRRRGASLWFVAATCAVLAAIIGLPWVENLVTDPSANFIQLGEYLTIPGVVATLLLLGLLVGPLLFGAVWAARTAANRRA